MLVVVITISNYKSNWSDKCFFNCHNKLIEALGAKSTFIQGRLKIWTEHSTLILLISMPFKVAQQKFQHFYNLRRNEFSPNLKSVAQKMDLPRPFEVLDIFGGKSKSKAPKAFKFNTKWVPIEADNW